MDKHARLLMIIPLLILVLAACGEDGDGGSARKAPPSASQPASEIRITDQREIEIEGGRVLSLSPNGQWLIAYKRQVLCIYETASLTETSCVALEMEAIDRRSVVWSPDSKRVAFTENFFQYFHESDLWVLDVGTAKLTNLTDDGVERFRLAATSEDDEVVIDLVPAWSPDGKTLAFSRSIRKAGGWEGTVLYRISAGGGSPKKLNVVDAAVPGAVWPIIRWSVDGKKVLYTVGKPESDAPENGIWIVDEDGKDPEHVLRMTDPEMNLPILMDVSAGEDKALIWYGRLAMQGVEHPNTSYFALLDLETAMTEPLKRAKSEDIEFFGPVNAVFSPDGSKVLYVYRDAEGSFQLVVRDLEGVAENVLLSHTGLLGFQLEIGQGLNWADDDTVFVATSPEGGLLLSLGTE